MSFHSQIAINELLELADTAEAARRSAELLVNWLVEDSEERRWVDEARMKFAQALSRINAARHAIEYREEEVAAMREP